jgi:hypothetical protein
MAVVYVITSGTYSEYKIEAVFTAKPLAEAYAKYFGEDARIEEWPLDAPFEIRGVCSVSMTRDGRASTYKTHVDDPKDLGFQYYTRLTGNPYAPPDLLQWVVETDDEQRAIKVVNEKRAIILAHGAWGDETKTRALFVRGGA